jgi:POT family proton-dependent oligopeptide transporter
MNIYTLKKIDRFVSANLIDGLFILSGIVLFVLGILAARKKNEAQYVYFGSAVIVLGFWAYLTFYEGIPDPYEIPTSVFQSVNALFIMIFATIVAGFWIWWQRKGFESSSIFKMAVGTIIMGIGFLFMAKASLDINEYGEKSALIYLILAYFFHTIGELSASPVALSFITKLAPVKYVSILMGVYFAATGLGNKLAGTIGELAQSEPVKIELAEQGSSLIPVDDDGNKVEEFELIGKIEERSGDLVFIGEGGTDLTNFIQFSEEGKAKFQQNYDELIEGIEHTPTAMFDLKRNDEGNIVGNAQIFEQQDDRELWTFVSIFVLTVVFGILLILFLRKLKKLTHGAEDIDLDAKMH